MTKEYVRFELPKKPEEQGNYDGVVLEGTPEQAQYIQMNGFQPAENDTHYIDFSTEKTGERAVNSKGQEVEVMRIVTNRAPKVTQMVPSWMRKGHRPGW